MGCRWVFIYRAVIIVSISPCQELHYLHCTTHLKPAFGHEEVVFNALLSELVCDVEAHGAVLVVDLSFGVVVEDGVGIVDLFEFLCRFRVVGVLVWVILQCQFPYGGDLENKAFRGMLH